MSEEVNTTAPEPGITLPDDAATISSVSATDRLLGFNASGDPVTSTAEKVKEFANEGMVTTEAMNAALAGKFNKTGGDVDGDINVIGNTEYRDGGRTVIGRDTDGAFINSVSASGESVVQIRLWEDGRFTYWKKSSDGDRFCDVWHAGNFDPAECLSYKGGVVGDDLNNATLPGIYTYGDAALNRPTPFGILQVMRAPNGPWLVQIAFGTENQHVFFRKKTNWADWTGWRMIYDSANLGLATASANGLMSAEDRIKLNSVACALSLPVVTEDTPTTLEETDEDTAPAMAATPQACIRAQRAAQYQMQTDELLYEALEAFARNHPEYSEFTAWLETKDRIRQELPKPTLAEQEEGGGE